MNKEQLERDLAMCKRVLESINSMSQETCLSFESQSYEAQRYARRCLEELNRPNEKEETDAVKMEDFNAKICLHCGSKDHVSGDCVELKKAVNVLKSFSPTEPSSSCETEPKEPPTLEELEEYMKTRLEPKEPETFGWKEAAKLWAEGVELEFNPSSKECNDWHYFSPGVESISFYVRAYYRRKPLPPQEQEIWINIYRTNVYAYCTKEEAQRKSDGSREACIPITIKYHKGQGL